MKTRTIERLYRWCGVLAVLGPIAVISDGWWSEPALYVWVVAIFVWFLAAMSLIERDYELF